MSGRLLVITNLFHPDRGGGAAVFSDMILGLAEVGWDVTVFTTHPYYPEWRRKTDASPWRRQVDSIGNVRIVRHGVYMPTRPSKLGQRLLFEGSFVLSLCRSLRSGGRFDVVMVYCPLFGATVFAGLRRLLTREPLWLNVQDVPADAASATGIQKSKIIGRLAQAVQRLAFNRADVWSSISPEMVDRLERIVRRGQPVLLRPNWLNGSLAGEIDALPSKLGRKLGDPVRLLYAGNIGKKQGLLEFCRRVAAQPVRFSFKIHGDGSESDAIATWIREADDERFTFGPFLSEREFAAALHAADVFVITELSGAGASFIPSKMIPSMASATPILAVCDRTSPLGRAVHRHGVGVVVDWTEIGHGVERFLTEISSQQELQQLQESCLSAAQYHQRARAVAEFDSDLRRLSRHRNGGVA